MNDTQTPTPESTLTPDVLAPDETGVTPVTAPAAPLPVQRKAASLSKPVILGIGAFLILLIAVFILYVRTANQQAPTALATPTPTIILTPTPPQKLSAIATTSAFAAFQDTVASYSSKITSFTMQDGTLTPPIFELDLGLGK